VLIFETLLQDLSQTEIMDIKKAGDGRLLKFSS